MGRQRAFAAVRTGAVSVLSIMPSFPQTALAAPHLRPNRSWKEPAHGQVILGLVAYMGKHDSSSGTLPCRGIPCKEALGVISAPEAHSSLSEIFHRRNLSSKRWVPSAATKCHRGHMPSDGVVLSNAGWVTQRQRRLAPNLDGDVRRISFLAGNHLPSRRFCL
jgi:hypothetical protein